MRIWMSNSPWPKFGQNNRNTGRVRNDTAPPTTTVNESDDFTGTVRNATVWEVDEIEASGRFNQNDRLYYFTEGNPTGEDFASRTWKAPYPTTQTGRPN